jgi:ABC-type polysaccharide/polyol phosphate transport system ATPase subunit
MDFAIRAHRLSKQYVIGAARGDGTLYGLLGRMLQLGKRNGRQRQAPQKFEALRDVSFELRPGEVAGVVGRNGAGKSTLLKLLSRISAPTQGRIEIRGRLASLLEVGTGFHPELSGRENVYLNGAILGMKRAEVSRKFDEIVAFAEIDKFVDTPVKHYSSGMYVRLAFAVAAHLETDVLLVDEVLAVGDASFQRKSLGKMSDVAKGGRTVLFVSHNLGAVRNLCSRALLLEGGRLSFDGNVEEGLALYETSFSTGMGLAGDARFDGSLSDSIRFDQLICRQNNDVVGVIDPMREFQLEVHGAALARSARWNSRSAFFATACTSPRATTRRAAPGCVKGGSCPPSTFRRTFSSRAAIPSAWAPRARPATGSGAPTSQCWTSATTAATGHTTYVPAWSPSRIKRTGSSE